MSRRSLVVAVVAAVMAFTLAACATPSGRAGSGGRPADAPASQAPAPAPPAGEVIGQGTVMDVAGVVELCLGAVAESYPPQCSGIPLEGWSWDGAPGSESSGDVRWGGYAVQGTFDGVALAVTEPPILLALYDPLMFDDPTGGEPGDTDDATLLAIQDTLAEHLGSALLSSGPQDGRLWVDVVWDDGTLQDAADAEFGDDVVVIRSALREVH